MGLDMYLFKRNPRYETEEEAFLTYKAFNEVPYDIWKEIKEEKPEWMPLNEVMYWRKANMVHGWFMNCEGDWVEYAGNDDDHNCGYKHVLNSEVDHLIEVCKSIVDKGFDYNGEHFELTTENLDEKDAEDCKPSDIELCKEYLPTERGFFYGSYDYDGWYLWDVAHTYERLSALKEAGELDGDLYYHPWW